MTGEPIIAVLMSAYNGSRYIEEQIDSILLQEGVSVSLYVRDDGSTDATAGILRDYGGRCRNVHVIGGGQQLGPANSFMTTLYWAFEHSGADFFAFADQDDIWKPTKLISAVSAIGECEDLALYCSNQTVYSNGVECGLRYESRPNLTLPAVLFGNQVSGCTMVFTRALARELSAECARPEPRVLDMRMHDTWVMLVALALGRVVYDPISHINYRIHSNNAVGIKNDGMRPVRRMIISLGAAVRGETVGYRSACAAEVARCFPDAQGDGWDKVIELANYKKSFKGRYNMLVDADMRASSGESTVEYAAKVLLGAF